MSAKIGIFAIGLEAYWPQFSGMKERLMEHHQRLLEKFSPRDVVAAGMVDNPARAREAGLRFQAEDVDIIFCHLTTYASSEALLPVVRALGNVTLVLLNVQSVPALALDRTLTIDDWLGKGCTCAGLPEMTAVLRRFEHPFAVVSGYLEGDTILDEKISQWCDAANACRRLKSGNIGILGRPYPGMMDLNVDETQIFRTFGSYVKHLNWEDIAANIAHGFSQDDIERAGREVKEVFRLPEDLDEQHLTSMIEVYLATRRLVDEHRLIALSNHFEVQPSGYMHQIISASNPVFSMLTRQGIACPVEADVKTAIALTLMKSLAGSATLTELYSMDFNQDLCIVGHSGAGDPDIADEKPLLKMSAVFHGKPGSGFLTQFTPATGPVTMASVTQGADGQYMLVLAEGELVEGRTLQLGDTNALFRFRKGLRAFVDDWSACGPTHHCAMGRGYHAQAFHKLGQLLRIPVHEV